MAITYQQVFSLDDMPEYDTMFADSEVSADSNFFELVDPNLTFEQKKQYYKDQIIAAFAGTSPLKKEGETLTFFKAIYDGITMELVGGYIETDGITFRGHWYLTSPDGQGSRNKIHTATALQARKAFYQSLGLTRYKILTYVGSQLYTWIKSRISSGHITLVSETEDPNHLPGEYVHVTFHIEL